MIQMPNEWPDEIELLRNLEAIRLLLEPAFSAETALADSPSVPASAGHCAVVAKIVRDRFGGTMMRALVGGRSHWFNRIADFDVDLTADQFGFPRVLIAKTDGLYLGAEPRADDSLNAETIARAERLLELAGL